MVSKEVEDYYIDRYKNGKESTNLNINKDLWIDYQQFCLDLSRNRRKKITSSSRIRLLMVKDMLDNNKSK